MASQGRRTCKGEPPCGDCLRCRELEYASILRERGYVQDGLHGHSAGGNPERAEAARICAFWKKDDNER